MDYSMWYYVLAAIAATAFILTPLYLRTVVPTNEEHIVQKRGQTVSYGSGTKNGNTYYQWPSWIPLIGVVYTILPVSNFTVEMNSYDGYDIDMVPLECDVTGFFRIADSSRAAQRVSNFQELKNQLEPVLQSVIRTVLAAHPIREILTDRVAIGDSFTKEITEELKNWGVETVKNVSLMNIRDVKNSSVINNLQSMKRSEIEKNSRVEVAKNKRDAEVAEIEAKQIADVRKQEAEEAVGKRSAEKEQQVGLSAESASQAIKDAKKITQEKEMAITRVQQVQQAEIDKDVNVVIAEQAKEVAVLNAEGALEAKKREAEGIQVAGEARAKAETAILLAPVEAQIKLAKEIGLNDNYQQYLLGLKQIEAARDVGMEQAVVLSDADVKIMVQPTDAGTGLTNVMDIFSSKGGTKVANMMEALAQSPVGAEFLKKFTTSRDDKRDEPKAA